jgi:pimeloyl-ACP methyl ester carboxylesterase
VGSGVHLRAGALALGVVLAAGTGSGAASAAGMPCGTTPGLLCSSVVVPLDPQGVVPGTVSLHVEELPPNGPSTGAMFLIAGGPGQGSAHTFDLGEPSSAAFFRALFPGYTLVAYDDRGTGYSGVIDCPALQSSTTLGGQDVLAAQCASSLGAAASLYGTAEHAADLDAVRAALGFSKIGLYGVSYGTKLALAYASFYPANVQLMVLDSILPTDRPDPFSANVARAMPATLQAFCATACAAATPDFAGDVVAVANRLASAPVRGPVVQLDGRTRQDSLDAPDFLLVVLDADLSPGLAAELPAAVHAARLGYMAPLLRLHVLDDEAEDFDASDLSGGLYAATDCRDGPFPWPADSDPATRPALLQQAVAALPAGTFGPFGSWAAQVGNAGMCDLWPSPAGGADLTPNPLPNVPVLALSGGFDMRTPTADAQSVIAQFPQGKLIVVPGVGHSVVSADPDGCAALAVRDWILNQSSSETCPRPPFEVAPLGPFPRPLQSKRRLTAAKTYALAAKTLAESEATWLFDEGTATPLPGLAGGRLVPTPRGFRLAAYGIVPGVTVSGTVGVVPGSDTPWRFDGELKVGGRLAAAGSLFLDRSRLSGTLGGRSVPKG